MLAWILHDKGKSRENKIKKVFLKAKAEALEVTPPSDTLGRGVEKVL